MATWAKSLRSPTSTPKGSSGAIPNKFSLILVIASCQLVVNDGASLSAALLGEYKLLKVATSTSLAKIPVIIPTPACQLSSLIPIGASNGVTTCALWLKIDFSLS